MPKRLRSHRYNMMMTTAEMASLRRLAEANGMSASDFMRHLLHKAMREHEKETR